MTFEPGSDLPTCVDGLESVTVQTTAGTTTVTAALRRAPRTSKAEPSSGRYAREDVRWHLSAAEVASVSVGDTITDGQGETWIVLEARHATLGSRWECAARRLRLRVEESELLTLEQAEWSKDDAGAVTATWSVVQCDLVAWIQPLAASRQVEAGTVELATTHVIYLAEPQALTADHRVVDGVGGVYRIVLHENEGRIDVLSTVHVLRIDGAEA